MVNHADSGGASRFFYCAKASRSERGEGNTHPTVKPLKLCEYLARLILPPERDTPRRLLVPFSGSGSEMIGALRASWDEVEGIENNEAYVEIAHRRLDEIGA
jgi:site-specific DNA-methyltransferase (adenine-specific)